MIDRAFRRWRRRYDLTMTEVAAAAGTTAQSVWNWETGAHEPKVGMVIALERRYPGLFAELKRCKPAPKRRAAARGTAA